MESRIENMNGQEVNWKGFDWATWPSPNALMKVHDNIKNTVGRWNEIGHKRVLDIGAGMGQNAMYFAKMGLEVSAIEISDYAVEHIKDWAKEENLEIDAVVGDMHSLPYSANCFDCVFENHAIRHTDSTGLRKAISEIERVLKPGGEAFLTFLSKDSTEFIDKWWPVMDENTMISQNPAEKDIPHFYADLGDLNVILANFDIDNIEHRRYFFDGASKQGHYYVNARKK